MSKQEKKGLVPALRFPEFRDKGEWEEWTLVEIAKFRRGSFPQPYGLPEWYDENNGMPFVQVFDVDENLRLKAKTKNKISKLGAEQSVFIPKGTLIVTLQGSIGRVAITQYDAYIDRTLLLFETFLKPTEILFFAYVIQNLFDIEKEKAPGGIIKTITKEVLSDFKVHLPSLPEQQKIADCLASIDELITAQTQKLYALNTHKKGLMQQLFPAEGETIPKLRFPDFRGEGDWEECTLGDAATFVNGRAYKQEELLDHGKYRVLRVGNFFTNNEWYYSDLELEADKYCDFGDLLYAWSASFGPRIWRGEKVIYHYHIWKVLEKSGVDKSFLFVLLDYETERMKAKSANGLGLLHITKGTIEGWKCYLPNKDEQQKIADCLSSIDELIAGQTQKLKALKTHKKGLMQQLFPAMAEDCIDAKAEVSA